MYPNNSWRQAGPSNNWNENQHEDFNPNQDDDWNQNQDEDYGDNGDYQDEELGWQNNQGGSYRGWGSFNAGNWGPPPNYGRNRNQWGAGYGSDMPLVQYPVKHKPIAYLLRCGIPKDRLVNLPADYLSLITPEHCFVCDVMLESFHLSRAHYSSKGHWKKQNKWLAEQRNPLPQRARHEAPLKSRDLYCELCDVQITSKVHATSHYDGKSHRAIVEGRKKPRNSALLGRRMSARVDQLIRREKRFIKPISEIEKPVDVVQPKPTKSELYCDICKTSVTCTEQMTMHLNGKKHLNKEKQHILKMMKMDCSKDDNQQDDAKETAGEGTADDEREEQQEGADDDWDNGGGAWDDGDNEDKILREYM